MSGGERARIFIAIYLSLNPLVLMLDEPTAALDNQNSNNLLDNLIKYAKSKTAPMAITPPLIKVEFLPDVFFG